MNDLNNRIGQSFVGRVGGMEKRVSDLQSGEGRRVKDPLPLHGGLAISIV